MLSPQVLQQVSAVLHALKSRDEVRLAAVLMHGLYAALKPCMLDHTRLRNSSMQQEFIQEVVVCPVKIR